MLLKIHPDNPAPRKISMIVECLLGGGAIIYPTDTVYALGCSLKNRKGVEKICKIKGIKPEKADFSLICRSLSQLSDFTRSVDTSTYKLMNKALPGPYTFILNANNNVPKLFKRNKKTIGIRVPDNNIAESIVEALDNPLLTTSIRDDDEIIEYITDPELIYEKYKNKVDIVIDGGFGGNEGSTIIDCTGGGVEIIREGLGKLETLG